MKRAKPSRARESSPKQSLKLPDLDQAKSAVLNSLPSKESQRGYWHAIHEFIAWYCSEPRLSFSKAVVARYRIHLESRQLAPGTINGRLAAVRRLAYEAADGGLLTPDFAAGIRRVKGPKNLGVRLGNWLTTDQARALWQVPDANTLKGKRDRALLGVLLGCGLRRKGSDSYPGQCHAFARHNGAHSPTGEQTFYINDCGEFGGSSPKIGTVKLTGNARAAEVARRHPKSPIWEAWSVRSGKGAGPRLLGGLKPTMGHDQRKRSGDTGRLS